MRREIPLPPAVLSNLMEQACDITGRPYEAPDNSREIDEMKACLSKALCELSKRQRTVLYLYFREELSQAEIAVMLGISQQAVSKSMQGAIERLRNSKKFVKNTEAGL